MKVISIGNTIKRNTANGEKTVIELTLETQQGVLKITPFLDDHLSKLRPGDELKGYHLEQNGKYWNLRKNKEDNNRTNNNENRIMASLDDLHRKVGLLKTTLDGIVSKGGF